MAVRANHYFVHAVCEPSAVGVDAPAGHTVLLVERMPPRLAELKENLLRRISGLEAQAQEIGRVTGFDAVKELIRERHRGREKQLADWVATLDEVIGKLNGGVPAEDILNEHKDDFKDAKELNVDLLKPRRAKALVLLDELTEHRKIFERGSPVKEERALAARIMSRVAREIGQRRFGGEWYAREDDLRSDHPLVEAEKSRKKNIRQSGGPLHAFLSLGSNRPSDFHVLLVPSTRAAFGHVLRRIPQGGQLISLRDVPPESWIHAAMKLVLNSRTMKQDEWRNSVLRIREPAK